MKMESTSCDICGAGECTVIYRVKDWELGLPGDFSLVKCKSCGLVYLNPRPTKDEIQDYYPSGAYYAYQLYTNPYGSITAKIRNRIICGAPGYCSKTTNRLNRNINKLFYSLFRGYVDLVPFKRNGKLLEIGCGNGWRLVEMRQFGWDVYGVEISKKAVETAEKLFNLKVFHGTLEEAKFPDKFFDAVVLWNVLEHLHSPSSTLQEIHRILKPQGILGFSVPNFDCFDRKIFGKYWYAIMAPRHLYHFSLSTIQKLLEKTNFSLVNIKYRAFIYQNPKHSAVTMKRALAQNTNELSKKLKINTQILIKMLRSWFEKPVRYLASPNKPQNFGGTITIYARKNQC